MKSIMATIEVVGLDMMCFKVDSVTLEPKSSSYYEPAAWSDPKGEQMGIGEWQKKRSDRRDAEMKAYYARHAR